MPRRKRRWTGGGALHGRPEKFTVSVRGQQRGQRGRQRRGVWRRPVAAAPQNVAGYFYDAGDEGVQRLHLEAFGEKRPPAKGGNPRRVEVYFGPPGATW
jgi:hypothetical protein